MIGTILQGEPGIHDGFPQLTFKRAVAFVIRLGVQHPHHRTEQAGHGSGFQNDRVATGVNFLGMCRTLGFIDGYKRAFAHCEMVYGTMHVGSPSA